MVKIGRTTNLAKRMDNLQGGNAVPLRLLRKIRGGDHERVLHKNLAEYRRHGELFEMTPALVGYLNRFWRGDLDFRLIASTNFNEK